MALPGLHNVRFRQRWCCLPPPPTPAPTPPLSASQLSTAPPDTTIGRPASVLLLAARQRSGRSRSADRVADSDSRRSNNADRVFLRNTRRRLTELFPAPLTLNRILGRPQNSVKESAAAERPARIRLSDLETRLGAPQGTGRFPLSPGGVQPRSDAARLHPPPPA